VLAIRPAPVHFYQPNKERRSRHGDPVDTVVSQKLSKATRVKPCEKIYLARGVEQEEKSPKNG
jgi:hypothetical protein